MRKSILIAVLVVLGLAAMLLTGCGGGSSIGRFHVDNEAGSMPCFESRLFYQDFCLAMKKFEAGEITAVELAVQTLPYMEASEIENGAWIEIIDRAKVKCSIPNTSFSSRAYLVKGLESDEMCWISKGWCCVEQVGSEEL